MTFRINDGPFAGPGRRQGAEPRHPRPPDEGSRAQRRHPQSRIRPTAAISFDVAGRGELQLGILIENMRREGFEVTVSRPQVVFAYDEATKQKLEPIEEVIIDVDEGYRHHRAEAVGAQGHAARNAPLGRRAPAHVFHVPTRSLLGYQGELLTDTRGTAVMNKLFHAYAPFKGEVAGARAC